MSYADTSSLPVLRIGDDGDEVRVVQTALEQAGEYYRSGIHGSFDEDTDYAVKNFQQAHGLDDDGIVGRHTWAKLAEQFPEAFAAPTDVTFSDDEADVIEAHWSYGSLPSQQDRQEGEAILRDVLFRSAHHDAGLYADVLVRWESDWDPHEAGRELVEKTMEAAKSAYGGEPWEVVLNGGQAVASFIEGLFMDGMYAEYRGEAGTQRWWFYDAVGDGAAAALCNHGGFSPKWNDVLTAAASGAWELVAALPDESKHKVAAAALGASDWGLPATRDEWVRMLDASSGSAAVANGIRDLLWAMDGG